MRSETYNSAILHVPRGAKDSKILRINENCHEILLESESEMHLLLFNPQKSVHINIQLATRSKLILHSLFLNEASLSNQFCIDLIGEGAEVQFYGLIIAGGQQRIENITLINHKVPNCRSYESFKYLPDDTAVCVFNGKIVVAQNAQRTESYQSNRNLLGNCACRMLSRPQMEIYADNVKCSHGMTTGQLDETALFYMRSRGIPEAEAAKLLKIAFASDIVQSIPEGNVREQIIRTIEQRLM